MAELRPDEPRGYTLLVDAIRSMTAIDELAELRTFARQEHADDPRLLELEVIIDDRANDLLAELRVCDSPQLRSLDEGDDTYEGMDRD